MKYFFSIFIVVLLTQQTNVPTQFFWIQFNFFLYNLFIQIKKSVTITIKLGIGQSYCPKLGIQRESSFIKNIQKTKFSSLYPASSSRNVSRAAKNNTYMIKC